MGAQHALRHAREMDARRAAPARVGGWEIHPARCSSSTAGMWILSTPFADLVLCREQSGWRVGGAAYGVPHRVLSLDRSYDYRLGQFATDGWDRAVRALGWICHADLVRARTRTRRELRQLIWDASHIFPPDELLD